MRISGKAEARLTLIALVHRDPEGYGRLTRLLAELRPAAITVEASRYGLDFRVEKGPGLLNQMGRDIGRLAVNADISPGSAQHQSAVQGILSHGAIEAIRRQLQLPYEARAARDHCLRYGTNWEPIDSDEHSRAETALWGELTGSANIQKLLATDSYNLADAVRREALTALSVLKGETKPSVAPDDLFERDRQMAERITALLAAGPGRLTHIGGWRHFAPVEPDNLLGRLAIFEPCLMLLQA